MTSKKRKSNLFLGKIKEKILTCHERPKLYYLRQGAVQSPIELQPSRGEFSPILWTRSSKSLQQGLGIHSFRRKGPAQHSETFLNDSHVIHEKVRGGLREPGESKCAVIFLTTSVVNFICMFRQILHLDRICVYQTQRNYWPEPINSNTITVYLPASDKEITVDSHQSPCRQLHATIQLPTTRFSSATVARKRVSLFSIRAGITRQSSWNETTFLRKMFFPKSLQIMGIEAMTSKNCLLTRCVHFVLLTVKSVLHRWCNPVLKTANKQTCS